MHSLWDRRIFTLPRSTVLCLFYYYLFMINLHNAKTDDESLPFALPFDGYYCYLKCLAKCLENIKSIEECKPSCQQFQDNNRIICPKNDTSCWKLACNYANDSSVFEPLAVPASVVANYSAIYNFNPRKALLKWASTPGAQLYVVQMVDSDDSFNTWANGGLEKILSIANETVINKLNLCPVYQFRVAAVNRFEVSEFSDIVNLTKPVPLLTNSSLILEDNVFQTTPYSVHLNHDHAVFPNNGSVRIKVKFNEPYGWSLKDREVVPSFLPAFLLNCLGKGYTWPMPQAIYKADEGPYAYFEFPEFVIEKQCGFIITLQELKSKCGTTYKYSPGGLLLVNFTCNNTRNATCNENDELRSPSCNMELYSTIINPNITSYDNASSVSVNFRWKSPNNQYPIECYVFNISETKKPENEEQFFLKKHEKILRNFGLRNVCIDQSASEFRNESVTFDDIFESNKFYNVRLCAVYQQAASKNISWEVAGVIRVDLTEKWRKNPFESSVPLTPMHGDASTNLIIGIAIGVALFITVVVIIVVVKCGCFDRKKVIGDYGQRDSDNDGRYVNMPRRFDLWELPRQRLIIYEDQKLGSGAFGSVYKGLITGRLLSHKDANSVLAENWMKSENCEVAVKMLPEYADDSSKSEFRREINLMKQLGNHERLVNMMACVTVDEPFCLIVDYCADGDLLHYLRDRRQYMIKLEAEGIDINNLQEDNLPENVDFNMILCIKDLISFAWQISVGLEYLSQKGYIHRDVAARNVLVDKGKKAKIGDFGLCRYSCSDPIYMGKGGRLPIKWMALEAIKSYEFTVKSDVWSFGVLLFEIITLGGSPYPGIQPSDMQATLEEGKRMEQPDNCPEGLYPIMLETWQSEPDKRPTFSDLRERLRKMLETITEDYYYMSLNNARDYYNVVYNNTEGSETRFPSSGVDDDDNERPTTSGAAIYFVDKSDDDSFGDDKPKPTNRKPAVKPRTTMRATSRDGGGSEASSPSPTMIGNGNNNNNNNNNNVVKHTDSVNSQEMLISSPATERQKIKFKYPASKVSPSLENLTEFSSGAAAGGSHYYPYFSAFTNKGYVNSSLA